MKKALEILKRLKEVGAISVSEKISSEAIAELEAINLTRREWYQKGFNEAMKHKTCEWKQCTSEYDTSWEGTCGAKWTIEHGTPKENVVNFCPQCGGKLVEIEPKDNE